MAHVLSAFSSESLSGTIDPPEYVSSTANFLNGDQGPEYRRPNLKRPTTFFNEFMVLWTNVQTFVNYRLPPIPVQIARSILERLD